MQQFIWIIIGLLLPLFNALAWAGDTQEFTLANGLKLIVKEDHRSPVVFSSVWYRVGSSHEPLGITGVSHVLEHMMFRGTPRFGPGELSRIIADNGGKENAATSDDFTYYYEELPADKLAISFKLEADRMQHLSLDEQAFNKEIQIVMEERRLRTDDNPESKLFERFCATAYIASPYHHSTIGWMNDLANMRVIDIRQWYQTWYTPNNATVLVVGDVKSQEVYALTQQYFGPLPSRPLPVVKPQKEVEPLGKREAIVAVPAKLPYLFLGYNVPSLVTAASPSEAYALEILAALLNGGDSARLPTKLVRAKQIAASTSVAYDLYSRLDGLFILSALPAAKYNLEQVEGALLAEINSLKAKPVTPQELARSKTGLIASRTFQRDSIESQAGEIGSLISVGRFWQDAEAYSQRIQAVTAAQVQAVAKKYLSDQRLTVGKLQPLPMKSVNTG